jgi:methionine synthase II (cobalamin-independent)
MSPPDRLITAPDCGMKYQPCDIAFCKLQAVVKGGQD